MNILKWLSRTQSFLKQETEGEEFVVEAGKCVPGTNKECQFFGLGQPGHRDPEDALMPSFFMSGSNTSYFSNVPFGEVLWVPGARVAFKVMGVSYVSREVRAHLERLKVLSPGKISDTLRFPTAYWDPVTREYGAWVLRNNLEGISLSVGDPVEIHGKTYVILEIGGTGATSWIALEEKKPDN
jgi:hypothetical protein